MKEKWKIPWRTLLSWVLFASLLGSAVFAVIKAFQAPADPDLVSGGQRLKSDYILMLIQCALGLVVMFLPSILDRRFHLGIPNYIYVTYFIFLFCAICLGEVRNFYFTVPHWDTLLHALSAMMLGALGFSLVSILNDSPSTTMRLSPKFVGLFAFCFALAAGAAWEIYEYAFDGLLDLNMQKFRLENGQELVGRLALRDTMKDIVINAAGALIVSLVGAFTISRRRAKKRLTSREVSPCPKNRVIPR